MIKGLEEVNFDGNVIKVLVTQENFMYLVEVYEKQST